MNYIKSQDLTPHPPTLIKDPYPFPLPRDSRGYVNNIDLTPKPFCSGETKQTKKVNEVSNVPSFSYMSHPLLVVKAVP